MSKSRWLALAVVFAPIAAASQELVFVEAEAIPPPQPSQLSAGVNGIEVSPDGAHVYALYEVAIGDDLVLIYEVGLDGALTLIDSSVVVTNPNALALAPDGSAVFEVGNNGDLQAWRRDSGTGLLSFADVEYDSLGGGGYLQYALGVAVSPDGKNVYVAGQENAVTSFAWDGVAGTLTLADTDVTGQGALLLSSPGPIAVTPDGAFVLVLSLFDNALVVFARDAETGALTYADRFVDGVNGVNGLNGPSDIVVAPKSGGASIYVSSRFDGTVATFAEAPLGVSFVEATAKGTFPTALALRSDGTRLYVTDTILNRVASFERDPASGAIGAALLGEIADADPGVNGLAQPFSIAASPDGANLYVPSSEDDAIAVLRTPVPEPASAALGLAAIGGLARLVRRRSAVP